MNPGIRLACLLCMQKVLGPPPQVEPHPRWSQTPSAHSKLVGGDALPLEIQFLRRNGNIHRSEVQRGGDEKEEKYY